MLARSTLASRSPGRYVTRSATMARVTRSRRAAAAKAADSSAAGSALEGSPDADAAEATRSIWSSV